MKSKTLWTVHFFQHFMIPTNDSNIKVLDVDYLPNIVWISSSNEFSITYICKIKEYSGKRMTTYAHFVGIKKLRLFAAHSP